MSLSEELGTLKYSLDIGKKIGGQICKQTGEQLWKNSEKIVEKKGKRPLEKLGGKLHKINRARLYEIGEQQKHIIYWGDIV